MDLEKITNIGLNDMLIYLLDVNRVDILINMIKNVLDNNIEVYIVTNNGSANLRPTDENLIGARSNFIDLIKQIDDRLDEPNLIYSGDTRNKVEEIKK